ncbi:neutral zinc metallopeptidase [Sphaerisporangium flaviroseum]|uniref:neutral zinc metallopeptidase n=1 Tax=Sphaerisporangium flaviroseum TaxID=509199 RepID=UPI0031E75729
MTLLPGATAHAAQDADPIVHAEALTRNPLYKSGPLPGTPCAEPPVKAGDVASVRGYLTPLVKCLDQAWAAQFAKERLPFEKPAVRFITRPEKICGDAWGEHVQAIYCSSTRQIVVMLDKSVVDRPEDLFLMDVIAHEYGHHVQNMAGIWRAYDRLPSDDDAESYEQTRRHELQAECLAGAFIGSVWPSLRRTAEDWETLLDDDRESGDETGEARTHGKGRNMADWLDRGYRAAGPAGCNTWSASAAAVA